MMIGSENVWFVFAVNAWNNYFCTSFYVTIFRYEIGFKERNKVKVMLVDQETDILLLFVVALTILSIIALRNSNVR